MISSRVWDSNWSEERRVTGRRGYPRWAQAQRRQTCLLYLFFMFFVWWSLNLTCGCRDELWSLLMVFRVLWSHAEISPQNHLWGPEHHQHPSCAARSPCAGISLDPLNLFKRFWAINKQIQIIKILLKLLNYLSMYFLIEPWTCSHLYFWNNFLYLKSLINLTSWRRSQTAAPPSITRLSQSCCNMLLI